MGSAKLKLPQARYNFFFWIFCGVTALLFVLAGLQYRWISEVSQAERERLKDSLQLAMKSFARDFESEFFHPALMPQPLEGPLTADARIASQYDEWTRSSRYPELLQDWFLTRIAAPGHVDLLRFDPQSRTLVDSEWPQELSRFREFCIAESMSPKQMYVEIPDLEGVPAMIFPFGLAMRANARITSASPPPALGPAVGPTDWEIIQINPTSFQRFLSQLVEQDFLRKGDFNYDILIVRKPSNRVVYRSSSNLANLADLDAETFVGAADAAMPLYIPGGVPLTGGLFVKGAVSSFAIGIAVPTSKPGLGPGPEPRLEHGPITFPPDPARIQGPAAGWQLYAKHHSGSLESFASQFRARNLAVSFVAFVLLILGLAFALISAQRIRAMSKLQLEFAAGLSHELRTPLTAIRAAGYNLAHGSIASREDVVRYGAMIQQEGTRLSEMVEQALLFAQIQAGRCQYQRNPVRVAAVIEDAVVSCRELLLKYPCEIVSNVTPDLPPASTDEKALGHCVRNLLVNALKYSEKQGRVEISAQTAFQEQVAEIEISIANQGRGIDRDEMPHIFEPFFRGRNAAGTPGNGLGLYMVKAIVTALGGRIKAVSLPCETRFGLYVPASDTSNTLRKQSEE